LYISRPNVFNQAGVRLGGNQMTKSRLIIISPVAKDEVQIE